MTLSGKEPISSTAFESEIALIIVNDADRIRKQLASIRQILEYDLRPKPSRIIYDTYYDTREKFLRERKISLRIRRIGGTLLISTKSDIRRIAGNIIQRREMEQAWSYNSIRLLARNLGLKTPIMSVSKFQSISASRALAIMGLDVIQARRTRREARDIVNRGKTPTSILAKLMIDRVTYIFKDIRVEFSEVEVEAGGAKSLPRVREIANVLVSKYQPILQQWFHGKFVTGLAIQRLLKTKVLQTYLVKGELGPEAFELIDRTIRSGRF
jgi:adenylate cyclase class IV